MTQEEKEYNEILAHVMRCVSCATKLQEIQLHVKKEKEIQ